MSGLDVTDYFLRAGTSGALAGEMARLRSTSPQRFRVFSAAELAEDIPIMEFLVSGVWVAGSYGVLAGEKKTLKTYMDLALALAVASGKPFLGQFLVPRARPVLMYLGEGGRIPTMRRLQRLARAMHIDLASLPLRMVFDSGDITGEDFLASLRRAVDDVMPGLVIVDPLYAFHPQGIDSQNLYERGAMLAQVQASMPPDCAFLLADHFRKTGSKDLDLDSISQSGVGQWADSWILQRHDTPPRVDEGEFSIGVQFGSRQWGGQQYVVDWSIGRFNPESGEHDGEVSFGVRPVGWGSKGTPRSDNVAASILSLLDRQPDTFTKNEIRDRVKSQASVGAARFAEVWEELVQTGCIESASAPHDEGTRTVNRVLWRLSASYSPPRLTVQREATP